MTDPTPGALRPIPDPQAEMERLAEARNDPPGREWGVRHPDGFVTHHAKVSRSEVVTWRDAWSRNCPRSILEPQVINGHTLVYRDAPPWREE